MNREEFEEMKSGENEEIEEQDAAVEEEAIEDDVYEIEDEEDEEIEDEDDLPELPEEQKTAFQKRLEREQRKIREKAEAELKEEFESRYSPYKSVVDEMGGDPEKIRQAIREDKIRRQAEQEAYQEAQIQGQYNKWTPEQVNMYARQHADQKIAQQRKEDEIADLRVQVQINELKDNPDYLGIGKMKDEIRQVINASGGFLSVEQAYWALGGKQRADQMKREIEQRNAVKRRKKRSVQSDNPSSTSGDKPLPPEIEKQRQRMGLSVSEARALWEGTPKNLEEYRKQKG